jgi:sugar phosphate isomerase/epimerase
MTGFSYQLYSSRDHTPWSDVLKTLGKAGYKAVEGFGGVYDDPKAFRAAMTANGLKMPTAHFPIEMLEKQFGQAEAIAKTLGVKIMICPYLSAEDRPRDSKGWIAFGKRLEKIAVRAKAAGYAFAWHNHDFEFHSLPDGSSPMRHILEAAPNVDWEMDVAWAIRGGADPSVWIMAFGPRIVSVHVKDIAKAGMNIDQDGWSDVGSGVVDWKGLFKLLRAKTKAKHFVMEHDKPADAARFAKRSIAAANTF